MIEINNLTANQIDKKFLGEVARKVLMGENKGKLGLSIVLVSQTKIRELNNKYRQNYRPTDVLSFTYDNSGEIVICPQEVKKNAKRFHSTFVEELAKVLIHGILHLLAYSHGRGKEEAREMEEKQKYYLKRFF